MKSYTSMSPAKGAQTDLARVKSPEKPETRDLRAALVRLWLRGCLPSPCKGPKAPWPGRHVRLAGSRRPTGRLMVRSAPSTRDSQKRFASPEATLA